MGHETHDWHERECRVQATPIEGEPRDGAGTNDIRPEVQRAAAPQPPRQRQRQGQDDRECDETQLAGGVEHRQDQQPERIVSDREQEEERDARMPGAENDPRDEIAERDVRGNRDGPSPHEFRSIERQHQGGVNRGRPGHATDRRDQRYGRSAWRVQGTTWGRRLDDLLRRQREEEGHSDFVHREVEGVRDRLVTLSIDVGPDERDDRARDEQARVLEQGGESLSHLPSHRPCKRLENSRSLFTALRRGAWPA